MQQAVRPVAASSTPAVPTRFAVPAVRAQVKPVAPGQYELQAVIGQATNDKLVRAKELLGHAIAAGDIADVLDRALTVLVATLEKRRCAATDRPHRGPRRRSLNPRHVPAEVVRAVWERDGGRCAFVGENGHRCPERMCLELDHIVPVGRGGRSTVGNLRLLCRAHNQHVAEREYGKQFMAGRREAARRAATEERMRREAAAKAAKAREAAAAAALARQVDEVGPWLKGLGFNAAEARQAAARCVAIPDAPLEERVRVALRSLAPPGVRRTTPLVSVPA